jgi:hypothetical protein
MALNDAAGNNSRDSAPKWIVLNGEERTYAAVLELVDCLLVNPDLIFAFFLSCNQTTDEIGAKLARVVAASSTINLLGLPNNKFGPATYLAMAAALRVNTSLRELFMWNNEAADKSRIDAAFIEALQLNPNRPVGSKWMLYTNEWPVEDFERLQLKQTNLDILVYNYFFVLNLTISLFSL